MSAHHRAAEMQYDLVARLRARNLSGREIAVILKVTPGRVSQIESGGADRHGNDRRPDHGRSPDQKQQSA